MYIEVAAGRGWQQPRHPLEVKLHRMTIFLGKKCRQQLPNQFVSSAVVMERGNAALNDIFW